ncbi:hypothetical protein BP5796_02516 [Coleophoma crateriformis]|uniref:Trafficking protein particle complex subunit 2-like protein n=1 Tax=Coleophoma crateriformis TaxID=565419 RepID=A0A3D8SYV9_9HELO|nr:hypothetical protein BP5796_02516 [Coleophoma crateriformis]
MTTAIPSIACLGVIGKNNNPLHIHTFPSAPSNTPILTALQFSLLLSSTLDIFAARSKAPSNTPNLSGDFGLLHAIDERLAAYGFETNTGIKFVAVVDMRGRIVSEEVAAKGMGLGLREGEMKVIFKSMQMAYIRLLQNPFFDPDEYSPPTGLGGKRITERKFIEDIRRIGETWRPGVAAVAS